MNMQMIVLNQTSVKIFRIWTRSFLHRFIQIFKFTAQADSPKSAWVIFSYFNGLIYCLFLFILGK